MSLDNDFTSFYNYIRWWCNDVMCACVYIIKYIFSFYLRIRVNICDNFPSTIDSSLIHPQASKIDHFPSPHEKYILIVKRQKTTNTCFPVCDIPRVAIRRGWFLTGASCSVGRAFSRRTSASSSSNIQLQDRDLIYWKAWEAKAKAKSV